MYYDGMFAEKVLEIFRVYVETCHTSNMSSASRALGLHITTLEKWLKGTRDPGLSKIGPVMDMIGVRVLNVGEDAPLESDCMEELTTLRTRVHALEKELHAVSQERERALGQVELLRDLLREAQGGTVSPRKKALDASSSDSLTG